MSRQPRAQVADLTKATSAKLELIARRTGRTLEDVTELWVERAAIREYDGGARRADADAGALLDVAGLQARTETMTTTGVRK